MQNLFLYTVQMHTGILYWKWFNKCKPENVLSELSVKTLAMYFFAVPLPTESQSSIVY